jgi:hypothetical protein
MAAINQKNELREREALLNQQLQNPLPPSMAGLAAQNPTTSADLLGASLARNPFLDEPAAGNLAPGRVVGAPTFPQQEPPQPATGMSFTPSLPPNVGIGLMASLPQINNTNAGQSVGKAIYAAGASAAAPGGGNPIPSAFPHAGPHGGAAIRVGTT